MKTIEEMVMTDRHKLDQVIAVIVEGGAEAAILDILLDYDKLSSEEMIF